MELIVLGAGPAYTARRGASASAYLVRHDRQFLLLDLGQGSFSNLAATVEPATLSAILISHLHPDHFVDLVALRHYLRWEVDLERPLRVLAPAGLAGRLDGLDGAPGFLDGVMAVDDLALGTMMVGAFEVEVGRVTHADPSFAFRVSVAGASGGAGLVYSGDCGNASGLAPLVRPGDTLLSEATFGAGPVPRGAEHLGSVDAARIAAERGAGRLLLTHVLGSYSRPEAVAAAEAAFAGPIRFVTEGDRFDL